MLSGFFAALAGIVLVAYSGQATLGLGDPYLFQSIAAAVIGGVAILGGRGHYLGTVAGAISLIALISLLQAENMPEYGRSIVYGVAILVVLVLFGREERVVTSPGGQDAAVLSGLTRSNVRSSMTTEDTFAQRGRPRRSPRACRRPDAA